MNKKDLINALSAKLQKDKKNLLRTAKRRNPVSYTHLTLPTN